MQRPTLFLTVGLPGTGKTTGARLIEAEHHALRLTKDEWMKALFGPENPPLASDVIEGRLILLGMRALELGALGFIPKSSPMEEIIADLYQRRAS